MSTRKKHQKERPTQRAPKPASPAKSKGSFQREAITILALVVLTFIVYGSATQNGLLNWDDNFYITDSPYLKDLSWEGVKGIFSAYLVGNYHPITLLSYAIEYEVAGKIDPSLMHLTNVVFHVLNTVLVFLLGRQLLQHHWGGVVVALIFALHPMHVESVAWIAERKDVLYTFFFLLSVLAYLRFVCTNSASVYVLALFFFALSLLAKSAAAALAPLLFVLDYWLRRAWSWNLMLEKLPFLAMAIGIGIVALSSQAGAMEETFAPHFPFWQRPLIVGFALAFYLVRFIVPHGLSAIHPYPTDPGEALGPYMGPTIGVLLMLGSALFFAYRTRTYWRITITGLLFFLITLAMVLQVLPVGRAIVAERYTYVPYIGLSLVVAQLVIDTWRHGLGRSSMLSYVPAVLLVLVLAVFIGVTTRRIHLWKNSFTLFNDMLSKYPDDGLTHYNRGLTNYNAKNYKASIADYDACVTYKPDCVPCWFNRGLSYKELGDMPAVVRDMDATIRLKADHADAYRNRGNARAMMKDYGGSITDFTAALSYAPQDTDVMVNRGLSHYFAQDIEMACTDWRAAAAQHSRKGASLSKDHCVTP